MGKYLDIVTRTETKLLYFGLANIGYVMHLVPTSTGLNLNIKYYGDKGFLMEHKEDAAKLIEKAKEKKKDIIALVLEIQTGFYKS